MHLATIQSITRGRLRIAVSRTSPGHRLSSARKPSSLVSAVSAVDIAPEKFSAERDTMLDSIRSALKKNEKRTVQAPKTKVSQERDTYEEDLLNDFCARIPRTDDPQQSHDLGKMTEWVSELIHNTLGPLRREIRGLKSEHLQTIKNLESDRAQDLRKFQQLLDQEKRASRDLQASHNAQLQKLKRERDGELQSMDRQHKAELQDVKKQEKAAHERQLTDITAKTRAEVEKLKRDQIGVRQMLEEKVSQLEGSLAVSKSTAEEEKQNMLDMHDAKIAAMEAKFLSDKSELEREYQTREAGFAAQTEELSAALISRDDDVYTAKIFTISAIPQKSDEKIRGSFTEIVKAVDDLSRLAWKVDQRAFTVADLERLRGRSSDRLLRKAIIQDLLWSCLYEFLFASPFRILGDEGQELEKEWAKQDGRGAPPNHDMYVWPNPGTQIERWRYMTLSQCREVLSTPKIFEWDARARIKSGFGETQAKFAKAVTALMGEVVDISPDTAQAVDRIAKRTSRMWLEFGMQRCRIVVNLTGSGDRLPAKRLAAIRDGGLKLTVSPTIGRFGNMKGADLGSFTVIGGCEGEALETMGV